MALPLFASEGVAPLGGGTIGSNALAHSSCQIVVGPSAGDDVVAAFVEKGYAPILTESAQNGDFFAIASTSCHDELGIFKWQVCNSSIRIYSRVNDRSVVVATESDKQELNFEFTKRYPRREALLGAIKKIPKCSAVK